MKTLIIYDETGYPLTVASGTELREPIGIPFLLVEVPEGKKVVGVNTSVTPHQVILEDIPPSEIDVLRNDLNDAVMELSMLIAMGGSK